jgi:phosphinothricin acetyltransferase
MEENMIRPATRNDIPAMTEIYNYVIERNSATYDIEYKTIEQRTAWFESHKENNPILVYEQNNKVIGYAGLSPFGPDDGYVYSVKLCIYLHSDARGEGIGYELMEELISLAKSMDNIHTIVSEITSTNLPSIGIHESFGFNYVGVLKDIAYKFGEYHDMLFYQLMV